MNRRTALALSALAVPAVLLPATTASASSGSDHGSKAEHTSMDEHGHGAQVYRSTLMQLNDSGATGRVVMRLKGDDLTVRIKARGLVPNQPHAQHIHGKGSSECPTMSAAGADGLLSVLEGVPFYGPIVKSLTVSGDTSPKAALTIELMPVADEKGRIDYRRTIDLPDDVSKHLEDYQIVQHGIDVNHNGMYDFSAGPSEIAPAFPFEATAPANCGTIERVGHSHSH